MSYLTGQKETFIFRNVKTYGGWKHNPPDVVIIRKSKRASKKS